MERSGGLTSCRTGRQIEPHARRFADGCSYNGMCTQNGARSPHLTPIIKIILRWLDKPYRGICPLCVHSFKGGNTSSVLQHNLELKSFITYTHIYLFNN